MNHSTCKRWLPVLGTVSLLLGAACAVPGRALATELVYVPVNPAFGGSPLNGSVLLGNAQAQDKHKDPDTKDSLSNSSLNKTPLQQFNENLERAILSQLASAATSGVISNGKLVPGTVETSNFTINIADLGGGLLRVTTTDKATGATSTFEVGK